jgi:hypothetical protein
MTREVWERALARRAALDECAPRQNDRRHADRDVHQERSAPPRGVDQRASHRRSEARGQRRVGRPQRDSMRALACGERVHDERQRSRHYDRRADCLDDPSRHQQLGAGRQCARGRRRGEHEQAELGDPLPPEQIRGASSRHEERREDDVVGVEHP